ncbi:hypothetical protein ACFL1R_06245 [Candidatus Latescibacterota bacterium]
MSNSLKAALLSGLVFPGLGYIFLKLRKRGFALMLAVLVGLLVIVVNVVQQALTVLEKIELESGLIDMSTIHNVATQAYSSFDSPIFKLVLLFIIHCWVFGVVDAYRIGKRKDIEEQSTSQVTTTD